MFNTEGVKLKNNKKDSNIPKIVFNPSILFDSAITLPAFSSNSSPNKFRNFEILEKLISKTLNDETKELSKFYDTFNTRKMLTRISLLITFFAYNIFHFQNHTIFMTNFQINALKVSR